MKVIVSDPISDDGLNIFKQNGIDVIDAVGVKIDENYEHIREANGWVIRSGTTLDASILRKASSLSVIGRAGVGIDNIDIYAATRRGVVVMNTPDANTISAAEHTLALILALSRNVSQGHQSLLDGKWDRHKFVGSELRNKTLGIVGLGKIGREVMQRAQGFSMKTIGYDPFIKEGMFRSDEIELYELNELVENSDFITIHIPLTVDTENIFDYKMLSKMKKDARIVNVARGGIINEEDLAAVLEEEKIAGAAIDVFKHEPILKNNPLLKAPNIILTPHLGGSTKEAKAGVSTTICNQIKNYLINEELENAVNFPIQNSSDLKAIAPFLSLAGSMGLIHGAISDGPIKKVSINCFGLLDQVKPIALSFLKSLLEKRVPDRVNFINAETIAKELGIEVSMNYTSLDSNYANLISAEVVSSCSVAIEGSVFDDNLPRLVKLMGYKMEVNISGTLLLIKNDDVPGVIGKVGTLLGENSINIGAYLLSQDSSEGLAFGVIRLDNPIDLAIIALLKDMEEIKFVKQIDVSSEL
jgi:D-3-phosphoglycerate dehydrogenase